VESHSAVKVPAIVMCSEVPAKGAYRGPTKAGRSSTVQPDLTVGCGRRKARQTTENLKYEHGGRRQGHDFSNADRTDRATQERVQY